MISDVPPSARGSSCCCCFGGPTTVQPYGGSSSVQYGGSSSVQYGGSTYGQGSGGSSAGPSGPPSSGGCCPSLGSCCSPTSLCCIRKSVITTFVMFAFGIALPVVYFISAYANTTRFGVKASEISQVEGSACADFERVDRAWALLLSAAALGTACTLLQSFIMCSDGRKRKLSKVVSCLSLGPFICSCMLLDIWLNIPEGCQELLEGSFDLYIPLWTGIQVAVYALFVGLSLAGLACCLVGFCACFCGANLLFGADDDDFEVPEIFNNPAAFEAKMEQMRIAMRQIEQMERDGKRIIV